MISVKTLSIFNLTVTFGTLLRVLLFRWEENSRCYVLCNSKKNTADYFLLNFQPAFNIAVRLLVVTFMVYNLHNRASDFSEVTFGYIFVGISLMAIPAHVQYLLNTPDLIDYLNNLIGINMHAGNVK
jgi:hypothetical protein